MSTTSKIPEVAGGMPTTLHFTETVYVTATPVPDNLVKAAQQTYDGQYAPDAAIGIPAATPVWTPAPAWAPESGPSMLPATPTDFVIPKTPGSGVDNGHYCAGVITAIIAGFIAVGVAGSRLFCFRKKSGVFSWSHRPEEKVEDTESLEGGSEKGQNPKVTIHGRCADPERYWKERSQYRGPWDGSQ